MEELILITEGEETGFMKHPSSCDGFSIHFPLLLPNTWLQIAFPTSSPGCALALAANTEVSSHKQYPSHAPSRCLQLVCLGVHPAPQRVPAGKQPALCSQTSGRAGNQATVPELFASPTHPRDFTASPSSLRENYNIGWEI